MREINATDDAAQTQMVRAMLPARLGGVEQGRELLAETLENGRRSGSAGTVFLCRNGLAELARYSGDIEASWAYLRSAEVRRDKPWYGPPQLPAIQDICAAHLRLAAGDLDDARESLVEAFQHGRIAVDMPVLARVAIAVACYVEGLGDDTGAARALGDASGLRGGYDLGDAVFDDACAAGRAMAREESAALLARIIEPGSGPGTAQALRR